MPNWYLVLGVIAVSWALVLLLERMGRLGAERHAILLIFKTERGKEFISRIAGYRRFWWLYGTLGVVLGTVGIPFILYLIFKALYSKYFLSAPPPEGTMTLVIPGVTIPFWYGIVGLATVLLFHEVSHGIMARREGVALKSLGAVFLTIIPIGAFVEPDEDELKAKERLARLRVYAAGSFGNILIAAVTFLILASSGPFFQGDGLQISSVVPDSPASGVLEVDMVLKEIDGKSIESVQDFSAAVRDITPGQVVMIKTDRGVYQVTTVEHKDRPGRGLIGISVGPFLKEGAPRYLYFSLYWILFLNFGIGLTNLAPLHFGIAATDGHHILKEVLERFLGGKGGERLSVFISSLTLVAIIFTMVGPLPKAF
ncbi:MAG: site-2 protease family protein [Candidatus Hydrothermarchaeota archaeon]